MKTFTLAQAINVLNENFKGYKILKKWDNVRELCIVFWTEMGRNGSFSAVGIITSKR